MSTDKPMMAALAIFTSMFMLGFLDGLVAEIAIHLGLWQFHLMRSIMATSFMGFAAWLGYVNLRPKRLWAVAIRGGFAALAMLIYFGCLGFLPISQVAAGLFSSPIWVLLISALVFKQHVGIVRVIAAAIGFWGVMMVLDPFAGEIATISFIPIVAGLFYAIGGFATRQWCEGESVFSMLFFFFVALGVFGLVGSAVMTVWPHHVPDGADGYILRGIIWPSGWAMTLTLVQAVGSIIALALVFKGYQLGDAAQIAIYEYSLLGFAAGWSFVLYGDVLSMREVLGMLLIVISGAVISLRSKKS